MAATGKTPILLYGSTTATNQPSAGNLTNSSDGCEIAINVADKNLFFKDATNTVNTVPIRQSSASSDGWLSSADWSTFNSKQPAGSYLTSVTVDSPLTGAGTSGSHLSIPAASGSTNGYLSSTDWTTFNNKQPAGTYVTSVTGTAPVVSSGGTTPAISMAAATGSVNGYLTSTDWTTFNSKQPAGSYAVTNVGNTFTGNQVVNGTVSTTTVIVANAGTIEQNGAAGGLYFHNTAVSGGATNQRFYTTNASGVAQLQLQLSGGTTPVNILYGDVKAETGNFVVGTPGKGIDFSATAGTGTSELLADYEEGDWTATVTPSSGSFTTITYGTNTYTKVGNIVTVTCRFTITAIGTGAGTMTISGLPYTASSAYEQKPFSCRRVNDGVTLFGQVSGTTLGAITTVSGATGIVDTYIYTVCAFYTV